MKLDPEILKKIVDEKKRDFKKRVALAIFNSLIEIITLILFYAHWLLLVAD